MASDKCCCCSVWCWAIAFSIVGLIVTVVSLVGDHYGFVKYAENIGLPADWYGHVLSIRDYIQLGIYAAVLFNAVYYRSECLWLILTIVQLVNCLVQFAVFILVAVVVGELGDACYDKHHESEEDECELYMAGVLIAVLLSLRITLIFTVIVFKCWRAEMSSGSAQSNVA